MAYRITNAFQGPRWTIGELQAEIEAFCWLKGLDLKINKSGLIMQNVSLLVKGDGTKRESEEVVKALENIFRKYMEVRHE